MVESGGRVEVPLQLALQVCRDGDAERRCGGQRVRLPAHRLRPGRHPGAGPAGRHPGLSGRLHVNYRNDATTELGLCVGGKFRRYGAIYQSTLGRWVIMIRGLTH